MSVYETGAVESDDAEILKNDVSDPWKGPLPETDKYGKLTGKHYHKCCDCGHEALKNIGRENVPHRDGCRFEGGA